MVKRRFLCSLLCCSPCCAVLALVGANTRFVGANAMFATFAPRILWFAQRNLWLAPPNAGFAMGILSKTHQSSLCHKGVFRKPTSPPLPLREGPPLISVFSPQGRRGNRSSSSLVTISFYGWRTIRGLRQQQSCGLRYATAWTRITYGLLGACCAFRILAARELKQ